jgi:hypothetical protein
VPCQQLQGIGGIEILKRRKRGREILTQRMTQSLGMTGPLGRSTSLRPGHHLDRLASVHCQRPPGAAGGKRTLALISKSPQRRYQRIATMITPGGNRNPRTRTETDVPNTRDEASAHSAKLIIPRPNRPRLPT